MAFQRNLRNHLIAGGWTVYHASENKNKALRLIDMLRSIIKYKNFYNVAHIEVYSGPAFIWAEFTSRLLYKLRKTNHSNSTWR